MSEAGWILVVDDEEDVRELVGTASSASPGGRIAPYRLDGAPWTRPAHALAEVVTGRRLIPRVPRTCPSPR
jgi:hypothetical protein